jgi:hypothetical protein
LFLKAAAEDMCIQWVEVFEPLGRGHYGISGPPSEAEKGCGIIFLLVPLSPFLLLIGLVIGYKLLEVVFG